MGVRYWFGSRHQGHRPASPRDVASAEADSDDEDETGNGNEKQLTEDELNQD
ncbi:hypothetical protein HO173_009176 [Letharia columbiana]|uniref:Uncharacterized protein n=1 Tax=Letharia columbiana TaxID=112416 RepID=A0A8H6FPW6_9LECA|nr:uncharacterized protein HO173_009176 [Letharia columbiana]KAF6232510.1 hypothetical protein HO173_009176 [Letharia columbiana]